MKRLRFQPGDLVRCIHTQRQGLVIGYTHRKFNVIWDNDIKYFMGSWGAFLISGYAPKRLKKLLSLTDEELLTHESKYVRALYVAPGKRQWLRRVKHIDNYEFNWAFLPDNTYNNYDTLALSTSEDKTVSLQTAFANKTMCPTQSNLKIVHWRTQID